MAYRRLELRLPADLHRQLADAARRDSVSVAATIRRLVAAGLRQQQP